MSIQANIAHLPLVENKIRDLILQETLDNQVLQVLNDPQATQEVIKELENLQENSGADSSTWKNETQVSNYPLFLYFSYKFSI